MPYDIIPGIPVRLLRVETISHILYRRSETKYCTRELVRIPIYCWLYSHKDECKVSLSSLLDAVRPSFASISLSARGNSSLEDGLHVVCMVDAYSIQTWSCGSWDANHVCRAFGRARRLHCSSCIERGQSSGKFVINLTRLIFYYEVHDKQDEV